MTIFETNLNYIKDHNKQLFERLISLNTDDIPPFEFVASQNGDTNIFYKNNFLHSEINPQQEAVDTFNLIPDKSHYSFLIMIGLGLGYLLKRCSISSESKIVVYEPDIYFLRLVLDVVDFSDIFQRGKIYIANTQTELLSFLEEHYVYGDFIDPVWLNSAQSLYSKEIDYVAKFLSSIKQNLDINYNTLFLRSMEWLHEGFKNIPEYFKYNTVELFRDKFKGKPALIVGAGPSLNSQIEPLKALQNKAIIFSAGGAFNTLKNNGINPDFVSFIEAYQSALYQVKDSDLSTTNMLNLSVALNALFEVNARDKFVVYTKNDLISRLLSKICGFSVEDYLVKGNVSYLSLLTAFISGCSPIILIGQDLSYPDGNCYCKGCNYDFLYCEFDTAQDKYVLKTNDMSKFVDKLVKDNVVPDVQGVVESYFNDLNSKLCTVSGQNGEKLPSASDFAGFIGQFEQFAYENKSKVEFINCSKGGAQINGFKNQDLNAALANFDEINDKISFIDCLKQNCDNPIVNHKAEIDSVLNQILSDAEKFNAVANQGITSAKRLLQELKRLHYNINVIKKESNTLIELYIKFKDELFAKQEVFSACAFKQILELSKVMDTQDTKNPLNDLKNIGQYSLAFYEEFLKNSEILGKYIKDYLNSL